MDELRKKRVEEDIRSEIASLILSGNIKDPRVNSFLVITRVEAAKDASYARIHVSTFKDGELEKGVNGLNSAAGFIQSFIGRRMRLRKTPKLVFLADYGMKDGFDLGKKIEEVRIHDDENG